jgi:dynein heavy chain
MFSEEGEKVNFIKMLDPLNKNVEDWMGELEDMMKKSVRAAFLKAVTDYPTPSRTEWTKNHPG